MAQGRGILGLPDAVLGRICSQFCPHCVGEDCLGDCLGSFELPGSFWGPEYFGTLGALTQVNKRIGRRAQAARFHVFCGRRDSLPLLARTLVECPALGANIFVVRLGDRDKDSDHGCILRDLATLQDVERLKELAVPEPDPTLDLLCPVGEQRLLAPFKQLPPIEDSFFSAPRNGDIVLGIRGDDPPTWAPADAPVAIERIANARLNAFVLFKQAENIQSIAILSEWPLALFPELKPARRIIVQQAQPTTAGALNLDPLCKVEELRLDSSNENPHRGSQKCQVDISKIANFLTHIPKLRNLEIRGGTGQLIGMQIPACRAFFKNITVLNLTATSASTARNIFWCCSNQSLKHFRFTIPAGAGCILRDGHDVQGSAIVALLRELRRQKTIETLHIDTAESTLFAANVADISERFNTVSTLSDFTALRHLTISADNIYYPSQFPRVLLRDGNTGNEHSHRRLIDFLPTTIESFEILAIYAIQTRDVAHVPDECHPRGKLPKLKSVLLHGQTDDSDVPRPITRCRYPLPTDGGEDNFEDWYHVADVAKADGKRINEQMAGRYKEAGVKYKFDMPEFFIDQYVAEHNFDPEA
ncbi:hypothetical protein C8A01DRAFT_48580 [Parachaetomium inaequale]|uniref:Uncharacterized protein n=1 Tax=Parachaetomium inaequale TaxID=2588326 RepID=A0AAN6PBA9_9PEZI|nr:hypothetical protein C8A01DRAFT_48580 [Parachaetomium inaequale]